MELKKLTQDLRMILYQNNDPDTLKVEFKRIFSLYDCEVTVNVIDSKAGVIIDAEPHIRFFKTKGMSVKIYEKIFKGSPLEKYKELNKWQKKKTFPSKSVERRVKIQTANSR